MIVARYASWITSATSAAATAGGGAVEQPVLTRASYGGAGSFAAVRSAVTQSSFDRSDTLDQSAHEQLFSYDMLLTSSESPNSNVAARR
jgi:hypothetical protein